MGTKKKTSKTTKKAPSKTSKTAAKPAKASASKGTTTARGKTPAKKEAKASKESKISKDTKAAKDVKVTKKAATTGARKAAGGEAGAKAGAKASDAKVKGKVSAKAAAATAPASNAKAPAASAAAPEAGGADKKKAGPKGITIVHQKPSKPSKPKAKFQLPQGEPLLKPGAKWKPLIPSGPSAPPRNDLEQGGQADGEPIKTKLSKKELEKYRQVLLAKRAELVGDVRNMESEALLQSSGSLSHTPQHMAEQGTDVFDQSLNLDLAAVDRTLIREIDAALERIDAGTYGICEYTGKPISTERLDELPWTRYSIEAARERERRSYQP